VGGGGKSGKLFVTGDDGISRSADALMYFQFLFLNFCYPLPPPTAKPKIPMGNSGGELVVGVGEADFSTFGGNVLFRG